VINEIYREDLYSDDLTKVSFHVWIVPMWYRLLVPYQIRRKVKRDRRKMPLFLRPRLRRVATFRWEHHEPSGINFKKGVGVIGRCIDLNEKGKPFLVRMDSDTFQAALRAGKDAWRSQDIKITQNLKFKDAEALAGSYGQVAALVLRERSGEAIGCITLDLPSGAKISLRRSSNGKQLLRKLSAAAEQCETLLTRKPPIN
jgi:hypothetical protein